MRTLEDRLGVRLVNRTTRSVALTEAGATLLARLEPALAELTRALDGVNEFRETVAMEAGSLPPGWRFLMHVMKVSEGGRVVIPVEIRRALGLNDGDPVYWRLSDGEAVLSTGRERIRRAQARIRQHVPKDVSLVDELLDERRMEGRHE